MKRVIDICSDLGEGFGNYSTADDASMMELISSANIACGFHAGDPRTMDHAVSKAMELGIGIGAHPSYPDAVGFGRRNMDLSYTEIVTDLLYQIGALSAFVQVYGGKIQHIFPHGQLGLRANHDRMYAEAIVDAVIKYDSTLIMMTQKGELATIAQKKGLKVANPIFADRAYHEDGTLVSRKEAGSVIHDPDLVVSRCLRMVLEGKVTAITGKDINIEGHTLLIHGDTQGSLELARKIREALEGADVSILPLGEWL